MVVRVVGGAALCRRAGGAVVAGPVHRHVLAAVRFIPLLLMMLVILLLHRARCPAAGEGRR